MTPELIFHPGPATTSDQGKMPASGTSAAAEMDPGSVLSTGESTLESSLTPPARKLKKNPYVSRKSLSFNTDPDMEGFEDVIEELDTAG